MSNTARLALLEAQAALFEARCLLARNRTVSEDPPERRRRRALEAEDLLLDAIEFLQEVHS